ncbi:MAG: thioredoxin family protein [Sinimarinibacterium sp.]
MFSSPSCGTCQQFEREVGDRYARTNDGKRIPLHRIGLHTPRPPQLAIIAEVRGTPTFVLLDADKEIGRITGYSGDELFWMRFAALVADLPLSLQ